MSEVQQARIRRDEDERIRDYSQKSMERIQEYERNAIRQADEIIAYEMDKMKEEMQRNKEMKEQALANIAANTLEEKERIVNELNKIQDEVKEKANRDLSSFKQEMARQISDLDKEIDSVDEMIRIEKERARALKQENATMNLEALEQKERDAKEAHRRKMEHTQLFSDLELGKLRVKEETSELKMNQIDIEEKKINELKVALQKDTANQVLANQVKTIKILETRNENAIVNTMNQRILRMEELLNTAEEIYGGCNEFTCVVGEKNDEQYYEEGYAAFQDFLMSIRALKSHMVGMNSMSRNIENDEERRAFVKKIREMNKVLQEGGLLINKFICAFKNKSRIDSKLSDEVDKFLIELRDKASNFEQVRKQKINLKEAYQGAEN